MNAVAPTASVAVRTLNMVLLVVAEMRILGRERKGLGFWVSDECRKSRRPRLRLQGKRPVKWDGNDDIVSVQRGGECE